MTLVAGALSLLNRHSRTKLLPSVVSLAAGALIVICGPLGERGEEGREVEEEEESDNVI